MPCSFTWATFSYNLLTKSLSTSFQHGLTSYREQTYLYPGAITKLKCNTCTNIVNLQHQFHIAPIQCSIHVPLASMFIQLINWNIKCLNWSV